MKAIVFTAPNQLELQDVPPPKPRDGEVLVRIICVGICGTDLQLFDGSSGYLKQGLLNYPFIPGHEWTGEIVQCGPGVKNFQPGDRVTGECHLGCGECEFCSQGQPNQCLHRTRVGILGKQGACAEFLTMPARSVHQLPPDVDDREGTLTEPLSVALYALNKADSLAGKTVAVFGLGTIGTLVLQVAIRSGASVCIGLDVLSERLERLRQDLDALTFHADEEHLREHIHQLAPQGIDVVIEASGVPQNLESCLEVVKPGGAVCLVGLYHGQQVAIHPDRLVSKDIRVFGNMASAKVWERALRMLGQRQIDSSACITHVIPFQDALSAFRLAASRKANVMKVIIEM